MLLEISQHSQENTCAKPPEACNYIKKETLAQVFSCEFCEISMNTIFDRTPKMSASGVITSELVLKVYEPFHDGGRYHIENVMKGLRTLQLRCSFLGKALS